jgi:hypothetical protein
MPAHGTLSMDSSTAVSGFARSRPNQLLANAEHVELFRLQKLGASKYARFCTFAVYQGYRNQAVNGNNNSNSPTRQCKTAQRTPMARMYSSKNQEMLRGRSQHQSVLYIHFPDIFYLLDIYNSLCPFLHIHDPADNPVCVVRMRAVRPDRVSRHDPSRFNLVVSRRSLGEICEPFLIFRIGWVRSTR